MPAFLCKIGTADGRVVEREYVASSPALLRESLEDQGFCVFRIRRRPLGLLLGSVGGAGKLSSRRFLVFNQELLVLLRAGLPVLQILDTLIDRMEPGRFLQSLREVREEVRAGSSLSEAFARHPDHFHPLYLAAVRAGERSGDLPVTLARFIAYQSRVEEVRRKIRSASVYPTVLAVAVVAALLFLLLYVIPNFTQIYADAEVQLPWITRMVIGAADGIRGGGVLVILLLIPALVLLLRTLLGTEGGAQLKDRWKLKVPYFGRLFNCYALSSYCRTLATVLASGTPLVPAMRMARGTLNNRSLEQRLSRAVDRVEEGGRLSASLEQTGFFPGIALRMIGVGETGGSLVDMLEEVGNFYEQEVERMLDRLTTLIEPAMMLVMGLVIGGIVVAMYIPIFQLAGAVG